MDATAPQTTLRHMMLLREKFFLGQVIKTKAEQTLVSIHNTEKTEGHTDKQEHHVLHRLVCH